MTDDTDEAVRRLLADARHDGPMPPEVAQRMDDVIAGLASERAGATVTPLRRRRLPQVLLAAAAVAVIGFGVSQVIPTDDASDGAGESAVHSEQAPADSGPRSGAPSIADERSDAQDRSGEKPDPSEGLAVQGLPTLTRLDADALEALRTDSRLTKASELRSYTATAGCALESTAGEGVPAVHEGRDVLVVYSPSVADAQRAQVLDCSRAEVLATVDLPGRE